MSTIFNGGQYTNGGYNSGIPSMGQNNYQPFMMPQVTPASTSNAGDPMSQYFGGLSNAGANGFTGSGNLGLGNHNSTLQTPSETKVLARFQGLAPKLDTEVNSEADQKIDVNDMQTALEDKSEKFNAEDKQVIKEILENTGGVRGKLDHLDGEDDGVISIDSINKMVVNPDAKQQTPQNKMTNTEACNVMADYMGTAIHLDKAGHRADKYVDKHGKLVAGQRGAWTTDRGKLQKLSQDDQVPEKVRTAAKKLLENKALLDRVDTAHKKGEPDGKYSIKDFQAAANQSDIDSVGTSETDRTAPGAESGSGHTSGSILPAPKSIPLAPESSTGSGSSHG